LSCQAPELSIGTLPDQDHLDGFQENLDVEPQAPVFDVLDVQPGDLVEIRDPVPPADLPKTREPGLDADPLAMPVLVLLDLVRGRGPGPDEAHLAAENVPELGEFVKARFPQEPSDPCDPGILPDLKHGAVHLVLLQQFFFPGFGVGVHRTELPARENAPVFPDPFLSEENRTGGVDLDRDGDERECDPCNEEPHDRPRDVETPLAPHFMSPVNIPVQVIRFSTPQVLARAISFFCHPSWSGPAITKCNAESFSAFIVLARHASA